MQKWNPNPSGWDSLSNFAGQIPDDNLLVLMSRNRDSEILTESNWTCALKQLGGESDTVQIVRHGHWACGWIEYLMIDSADTAKVTIGEEIEKQLDAYPILNEDHYSTLQLEAIWEYWQHCSLRERVEYCREATVSIFASRRDNEIPDRVEERLMEQFL